MPFLDAALAFALTMLAVSTASGQLLDLGRKIFNRRSANLEKMLTAFCEEELAPVVEREMNRLSDRTDEKVREVLGAATRVMARSGAGPLLGVETGASVGRGTSKIERLSTSDLVERVKRSELGAHLLRELNDEAEVVFEQIGERWDRAGEAATESFRKRSGWWASLAALLLALTINVDSWYILDSYMNDRALTADVVAQFDSVRSSAADAMARIAAADSSMAEIEAALGTDSLAARRALDELTADFQATAASVNRLEDSGLPVGWTEFPYACVGTAAGGPTSAACATEHGRQLWKWVVGIALTAILAGLGAPFWYDTVSGITQLARAVRGPKGGGGGQAGT